ncbi:hypothetical protein QZJ86_12240 [Methylomonas montana]|uniref:hypothetical protein n=1 Tax=Methylomonas montana TaxID=3058963 RepID=UPI002657CEE6|nr:hypothetical protein [Methylomonas montana]WKJ88792.1 hypothetical protein QZJ86_12240 [Methylomonas montana]
MSIHKTNQPVRTLYKVCCRNWEIRIVTGQPWPGQDSEGDKCFVNTHFENELDAIKRLIDCAWARLSLAQRAISTAEYHLRQAKQEGAGSKAAIEKLRTEYPDYFQHDADAEND